MFGRVSPYYDLLNRILSLGLDQGWRRRALAELKLPAKGRLLDVATGTGDVALWALRLFPQCQVVGVDLSAPMLALGRKKVGGERCSLLLAQAQRLPFASHAFDAVVCAFGVRNFSPLFPCLQEMGRVIRPRGQVAILELTRPSFPPLRFLHALYLRSVVPALGGLFGRLGAYRYLTASVFAFPPPEAFLSLLVRAGFQNPHHIPLSGGVAGVFLGERGA